MYLNERDDPLGAHLFAMTGHRWRNLRAKLSPTFSSGKMKGMFGLVVECGKGLVERVKGLEVVDVKECVSSYNIELIGSCAFGLDCASRGGDFQKMSERVFHTNFFEGTKRGVAILFPDLARGLRVSLTPKPVETFFTNLIKSTIKQRKDNSVRRNDFLQLLLEVQEKEGLSFEEMCAQCFVFFLGGFETTSTLASYCLFELAKNQDVQDKVRDEVRRVCGGEEDFSYEAIHGMKYLGCVLEGKKQKTKKFKKVRLCCCYKLTVGKLIIIPWYKTKSIFISISSTFSKNHCYTIILKLCFKNSYLSLESQYSTCELLT